MRPDIPARRAGLPDRPGRDARLTPARWPCYDCRTGCHAPARRTAARQPSSDLRTSRPRDHRLAARRGGTGFEGGRRGRRQGHRGGGRPARAPGRRGWRGQTESDPVGRGDLGRAGKPAACRATGHARDGDAVRPHVPQLRGVIAATDHAMRRPTSCGRPGGLSGCSQPPAGNALAQELGGPNGKEQGRADHRSSRVGLLARWHVGSALDSSVPGRWPRLPRRHRVEGLRAVLARRSRAREAARTQLAIVASCAFGTVATQHRPEGGSRVGVTLHLHIRAASAGLAPALRARRTSSSCDRTRSHGQPARCSRPWPTRSSATTCGARTHRDLHPGALRRACRQGGGPVRAERHDGQSETALSGVGDRLTAFGNQSASTSPCCVAFHSGA